MLKTGKLPNELLQEIVLRHLKPQRPEVLTGPGVGEDCAVIDFGDYECIMSTDPITAASARIGALAVHISCNDIASNGVAPLGVMLTMLLPEGSTESEVEEIVLQASEAASRLRVEIIGGHTEVTPAVNKPVIVSTAVGMAPKQSRRKYFAGDFVDAGEASAEWLAIIESTWDEETAEKQTDSESAQDKTSADRSAIIERAQDTAPAKQPATNKSLQGTISTQIYPETYNEKLRKAVLNLNEYAGNKEDMNPGDILYLTKTAGLEGTGIIAADFKDALTGALSPEEFTAAERMLDDVSVVYEGIIAGILGFTAMHDVTEGGILGAVWEMCQTNAVGAVIFEDQIPIAEVTRKICGHFKLNALRLISSGAMLIAVNPGKCHKIEQFMAMTGIRLSRIGEIKEIDQGVCMVTGAGGSICVEPPGSDEIYRVLSR